MRPLKFNFSVELETEASGLLPNSERRWVEIREGSNYIVPYTITGKYGFVDFRCKIYKYVSFFVIQQKTCTSFWKINMPSFGINWEITRSFHSGKEHLRLINLTMEDIAMSTCIQFRNTDGNDGYDFIDIQNRKGSDQKFIYSYWFFKKYWRMILMHNLLINKRSLKFNLQKFYWWMRWWIFVVAPLRLAE